ncbi:MULTISPECIES: relaxase/mobilization nuclease domain-containing protein [unclassified Flavobacterium]|uniref:relaxase/mobilization nuclease domain-containing protein n=1 Tax=unclassified Flavobacterium TaxID=196869 RepID=UPI0008695C62|nr:MULTISPECIES: relaxase/mobilization nuclease domain-containing protein [unclassified Flavobacterium]MBN9284094.1 relaxase/mobilization nuclease domain-containing protein [Flavobacterium sp.]ODS80763.1 MAG: relaxase [Chryseobacterium sp. SCN 40-13]OJV71110.1 MAG: relaxase [Flavobacterium sp. 40-81]
MVAIIKTGHSIHRIFNYNENKVKEGVALCIGEGNYPVDVENLTFSMKLNRLLKQAELNTNCKRNSVHISLNFDPSETNLSQEKMMEIAHEYMDRIGFGNQPYLVYQHYDAGHPHIHLVSVKVRQDGSRIDMQNIGKNQSEEARKAIEKKFNLVVAEGRNNNRNNKLEAIPLGKVNYGKIQSKKAIANVLNQILTNYNFTSLKELNAVLSQYNVLADRGTENSRVFKANGMVYRILDEAGNPTGVPIKASDFYNRPTMKILEQKFQENAKSRKPFKSRIKNVTDKILMNSRISIDEFINLMAKQGIAIVKRTSEDGRLYGITYVDHTSKCVFNGSELGKDYSAKAILERCTAKDNKPTEQILTKESETEIPTDRNAAPLTQHVPDTNAVSDTSVPAEKGLIDTLLEVENTLDFIPNQLKRKKRRRKRRRRDNNNNL